MCGIFQFAVITVAVNIKEYKYKVLLVFLCALLPTIALGVRNVEIGVDSVTYLKIFSDPASYAFPIEPGLVLLNRLVSLFTKSGNAYLMIISVIVNLLFFTAFLKIDRENFPLIWLLFYSSLLYFSLNLNIIRQGISMGLFLHAISEVERGKMKKAAVFGIVACTFHVTAGMVFVLMLFQKHTNLTVRTRSVVIALIVLFMLGNRYIANIIVALGGMIDNKRVGMLMAYIVDTDRIGGIARYKPWQLAGLVMLIYYLFRSDRKKQNDSLVIVYAGGYVVFSMTSINMLMADRLLYYFYPIGYVLIARLKDTIQEKQLFSYIVIFLSAIWFYKSIMLQYRNWFIPPYESITALVK